LQVEMTEVDKIVEETNRLIQDRKRQGRPSTTDPQKLELERKKYFFMVFGPNRPPPKMPEDNGKYSVYQSQGASKRGRGGGAGRGGGGGRRRGADDMDADLNFVMGDR
jgi:hypothetical protein